MKLYINNTFAISSNKHNWILTERVSKRKNKLHFFPTLRMLCDFFVEFRARECLGKAQVDLRNFSSGTPSYSSVIDQIVAKLEQHISSIIEGNEKCGRK